MFMTFSKYSILYLEHEEKGKKYSKNIIQNSLAIKKRMIHPVLNP